MNKALMVYGTRYGATTSTSQEIAAILRKQGIDVRVVNVKEEKVKNIAEYDLVFIGSGIQIFRWTSEPEDFLKKFQKELATKKVALFVSAGAAAIAEHERKLEEVETARRKYLQEKATKYNLQPVALGLFGGVYDFNKWPWWAGKAKPMAKQQLEAAGFKETNGIYDTRDWNAIRNWAKDLTTRI
ncbi:MAG TPA: flavodoxin domain-containing protein [Candidatus Binatia bacterium]|nr:flavodoxin domain-containing protein [Candidatus Binatia bacterium]